VKVTVKNLQKIIPINPRKITEVIFKVLSSEKIKKPGEINILVVGDKEIKEFNLLYLGCNSVTDVISFDDSTTKRELLADIVVSAEAARRNARIFKTVPLYELYLYVIHGILHLVGYDDNNKKNRVIMHQKEEYLCSNIFRLTNH